MAVITAQRIEVETCIVTEWLVQMVDLGKSLTHWVRPGIEPTTSCFLVRFVSDGMTFKPNSFFLGGGVFLPFRAVPAAYGGSQARGPVGAMLLATATPDPSHICNLHHSLWQRQILNPLSKARDGTLNLMFPSQICFYCARTGTLEILSLYNS